jgi:hypothetical protein
MCGLREAQRFQRGKNMMTIPLRDFKGEKSTEKKKKKHD